MKRRRTTALLVPLLGVLALALVTATPLAAQVPRPRPDSAALPDTGRAAAARRAAVLAGRDTVDLDSLAADSLALRELVDWVPADSITQELMQRAGFTVTRYQGASMRYNALQRELLLRGDTAGRAAVERGDSTLVVGDTIRFNDSTQVADVRGDTVFLRDPTQNIVARGRLVYDVQARQGLVTNLCTTVDNAGEDWYVCGERAAFVGATTPGGASRFYAHDSEFTTCELTIPHYHFEARNVKVIQDRLLVGRPAVMYIEGVPVAWLPFFFQDLRRGRRSGFMTPRFSLTDFVRTGTTYRRTIENLGYYFAINDYFDARAYLDWRSGANPTEGDPGWTRLNAETRYRWLSRFLEGRVGATYVTQQDGRRSQDYSWAHRQEFSSRTSLNFNLNYASSTQILRNNARLPTAAVASIVSQFNFQQKIGPATYSLGGNARQFAGREVKSIDAPTFNITSAPIALGEWLTWTPRLSLTNRMTLDEELGGAAGIRFSPTLIGGLDSTTQVLGDRRNTSITIGTPLRIFGFDWQNTFTIQDSEDDFAQFVDVVDPLSPTGFTRRAFQRTYLTSVDWQTGIALPSFSPGRWNLIPSVSIQNVEPGAGFLVRTERTGTEFVRQSKRAVYAVGASPTFFRLYDGFGPFARFRHAIQPTVSYNYSPRAQVSTEFLTAIGRDPRSYLGALAQSGISLALNTNIEARMRSSDTTASASASATDKMRLLSLNFSTLTYDFIRADTAGTGITNQTFDFTARSDLLPGFDLQVGYDLFQGSVLSDTARFDPFRTSVRATLNLDRNTSLVRSVAGLFGIRLLDPNAESATIRTAVPPGEAGGDPLDDRRGSGQMAGRSQRLPVEQIQGEESWRAAITFSSTRSRPFTGGNVITFDPTIQCRPLEFNPIAFENCVQRVRLTPPDDTPQSPGTFGRPTFVSPPVSSAQGSFGFQLTPQWTAQWQTNYDFVLNDFASHNVTLQRELHDWFANFSFVRASNGAFSFSFYIALKAEPDFKFDFNRQTYREPPR